MKGIFYIKDRLTEGFFNVPMLTIYDNDSSRKSNIQSLCFRKNSSVYSNKAGYCFLRPKNTKNGANNKSNAKESKSDDFFFLEP